MKLDEEFDKTLSNFLNKELNDAGFDDKIIEEYINEIQKYMNDEKTIKDKINDVVFKFIDNDKDKEDINCKRIIEIIYKEQYINKYTLDIVSLIIEYIKDNLYNKY
jgi:hypothetical protein